MRREVPVFDELRFGFSNKVASQFAGGVGDVRAGRFNGPLALHNLYFLNIKDISLSSISAEISIGETPSLSLPT